MLSTDFNFSLLPIAAIGRLCEKCEYQIVLLQGGRRYLANPLCQPFTGGLLLSFLARSSLEERLE